MNSHLSVQIIFCSCYLDQVLHWLDNSISEIRGLEKCSSLTHLSMEHNKILCISGLKNLPLRQLCLVMSVLSTGPWSKLKEPGFCLATVGVSMSPISWIDYPEKNINVVFLGHSSFSLEIRPTLVGWRRWWSFSVSAICLSARSHKQTRQLILANKLPNNAAQ